MISQKKDILYSALISYEWLFLCKKKNFPLRKELEKFEKIKGGPIINAGVLISFAYMTLVFAKESRLYNEFLFNNIKLNDFEIDLDKSKSSIKPLNFIRRIRNSLSHANLRFEGKYIIFEDGKPNKEIDFRVKILSSDFGNFMNRILHNWNSFEKSMNSNGSEK